MRTASPVDETHQSSLLEYPVRFSPTYLAYYLAKKKRTLGITEIRNHFAGLGNAQGAPSGAVIEALIRDKYPNPIPNRQKYADELFTVFDWLVNVAKIKVDDEIRKSINRFKDYIGSNTRISENEDTLKQSFIALKDLLVSIATEVKKDKKNVLVLNDEAIKRVTQIYNVNLACPQGFAVEMELVARTEGMASFLTSYIVSSAASLSKEHPIPAGMEIHIPPFLHYLLTADTPKDGFAFNLAIVGTVHAENRAKFLIGFSKYLHKELKSELPEGAEPSAAELLALRVNSESDPEVLKDRDTIVSVNLAPYFGEIIEGKNILAEFAHIAQANKQIKDAEADKEARELRREDESEEEARIDALDKNITDLQAAISAHSAAIKHLLELRPAFKALLVELVRMNEPTERTTGGTTVLPFPINTRPDLIKELATMFVLKNEKLEVNYEYSLARAPFLITEERRAAAEPKVTFVPIKEEGVAASEEARVLQILTLLDPLPSRNPEKTYRSAEFVGIYDLLMGSIEQSDYSNRPALKTLKALFDAVIENKIDKATFKTYFIGLVKAELEKLPIARRPDIKTRIAALDERHTLLDQYFDFCYANQENALLSLHLFKHIAQGDADEITEAKFTSVINLALPGGATPIHAAAFKGNLAVIEKLIAIRPEMNRASRSGSTVLYNAILTRDINDDTNAIQALIMAGAEVDKAARGQTPLYRAAQTGDIKLVKTLITAGANVRKTGINGLTALHAAAFNGNIEVIEALLKAGAEVNKSGATETIPLHLAIEGGHLDAVRVLIRAGADVNKANSIGNASLHTAAFNGKTAIAEVLLEAGAEVNKLNKKNFTPLHAAAQKGHLEVTKVLIKAGASLNKTTKERETPIFMASLNGYAPVVEALANAGADVHKSTNSIFKPIFLILHRPTHQISEPSVAALFKAGAFKDVRKVSFKYTDGYDGIKGRTKTSAARADWKKLVTAYGARCKLSAQDIEIAVSTPRKHDGLNLLHRTIATAFECNNDKDSDYLVDRFIKGSIEKGCRASDKTTEATEDSVDKNYAKKNAFELLIIATQKHLEKIAQPNPADPAKKAIDKIFDKVAKAIIKAHDKHAPLGEKSLDLIAGIEPHSILKKRLMDLALERTTPKPGTSVIAASSLQVRTQPGPAVPPIRA